MSRILGVVLAGGRSSRFGSDKALAQWNGQTLIARAVDTLSGWCDHVVVVGRAIAPAPTLPDWPASGMGPLGGLAAALRLARDDDYPGVLSVGVDCLGLPDDLPERLGVGTAPFSAAYVASQPIIGFWPAPVATIVETILLGSGRHSLHALAEATGARRVMLSFPPANINTLTDLHSFKVRD